MEYLVYVIVGISIGVISAVFGVGGGFILTPILSAMGMPIVYAIGTGLFFTVGVSLMAGRGHFLRGNCSLKTIGLITSFTVIGVTVAYKIVQWLTVKGSVELYIGVVYIVMLLCTSLFVYQKSSGTAPATNIPFINLRPYIYVEGDKKISLWNFVVVGLSVGFLQGFLGVGGGFILVPLLMGVLGMDPHSAVGNSLGILFISSIYAAGIYAFDSRVDYLVAGFLMISAYCGSYYGLRVVNKCKGKTLTRYFSVLLFLSTGGIVAKQIGFTRFGLYYSIIVTAIFAVYVLYRFKDEIIEDHFCQDSAATKNPKNY